MQVPPSWLPEPTSLTTPSFCNYLASLPNTKMNTATHQKVTSTKVKSAHYESITTNLAEFSLAEAVFLHKGRPDLITRPVCESRHGVSSGRDSERGPSRDGGREDHPAVQTDQQHLDGHQPARGHDQQAAGLPEEVCRRARDHFPL